jgi:hypothetical protein
MFRSRQFRFVATLAATFTALTAAAAAQETDTGHWKIQSVATRPSDQPFNVAFLEGDGWNDGRRARLAAYCPTGQFGRGATISIVLGKNVYRDRVWVRYSVDNNRSVLQDIRLAGFRAVMLSGKRFEEELAQGKTLNVELGIPGEATLRYAFDIAGSGNMMSALDCAGGQSAQETTATVPDAAPKSRKR